MTAASRREIPSHVCSKRTGTLKKGLFVPALGDIRARPLNFEVESYSVAQRWEECNAGSPSLPETN
jgi:hypothetical protein